ncbi:MAG: RNA 2',3'-cyclic phosphodiesterase [Propionibacteriaceae bacterium]|jgi:2'-5' RNA ligase|nr:RNA 2',3'-cyclic phosphodiesterase [Propionibacteriaceae bacterium]
MTDRLFAAVFPPAETLEALERLAGPRCDATLGWRWTRPANWHLTLAFFGDVADDRQEPLIEALAEVAASAGAFRLTVGGAGLFGKAKPRAAQSLLAKALWMGARAGGAELAALSARVRQASSRVGVHPDGSKFTAHLTLARATRPAPARGLLNAVESFGDFDFAVSEFLLVKSTLAPSGSSYQPVCGFQLAPLAVRAPEPPQP